MYSFTYMYMRYNQPILMLLQVIPVSKPVLPQIPEEPLPVIEYVHVTDDKELVSARGGS